MNAIVAVDQNWAIGNEGDLLMRISEDLKRFKALTTGHPVILGRKTLETFPGGRPLPGRPNLILSRNPDFQVEGAQIFPDEESLLSAAPADSFVIGGESVYQALLPHCDTVYVTKIEAAFPADTHFPNLDKDPDWMALPPSGPLTQGDLSFFYQTYQRVSK